jgi:hypothetical protein
MAEDTLHRFKTISNPLQSNSDRFCKANRSEWKESEWKESEYKYSETPLAFTGITQNGKTQQLKIFYQQLQDRERPKNIF